GKVTGNASSTLSIGTGETSTRSTSDSYSTTGSSDGVNAVKTYQDLVVSITPTATDVVGHQHTFTANVQINKGDGAGFVADSGATVTVVLTPSNGAAVVQDSPTSGTVSSGVVTYTLTTDSSGNATVIFHSNSAGKVTGNASSTL